MPTTTDQSRFDFVVDCIVRDLEEHRQRWLDDELHLRVGENEKRLTALQFNHAFHKAMTIAVGKMAADERAVFELRRVKIESEQRETNDA
jgi:hypothetical protein